MSRAGWATILDGSHGRLTSKPTLTPTPLLCPLTPFPMLHPVAPVRLLPYLAIPSCLVQVLVSPAFSLALSLASLQKVVSVSLLNPRRCSMRASRE